MSSYFMEIFLDLEEFLLIIKYHFVNVSCVEKYMEFKYNQGRENRGFNINGGFQNEESNRQKGLYGTSFTSQC